MNEIILDERARDYENNVFNVMLSQQYIPYFLKAAGSSIYFSDKRNTKVSYNVNSVDRGIPTLMGENQTVVNRTVNRTKRQDIEFTKFRIDHSISGIDLDVAKDNGTLSEMINQGETANTSELMVLHDAFMLGVFSEKQVQAGAYSPNGILVESTGNVTEFTPKTWTAGTTTSSEKSKDITEMIRGIEANLTVNIRGNSKVLISQKVYDDMLDTETSTNSNTELIANIEKKVGGTEVFLPTNLLDTASGGHIVVLQQDSKDWLFAVGSIPKTVFSEEDKVKEEWVTGVSTYVGEMVYHKKGVIARREITLA